MVWEQLTRQAYRFSMLQLDLQILTVPASPLPRRVWEWKLIRRLVLEAANNIVDYIKPQNIGYVSLPLATTGPGTYQIGLNP